MYYVDKTLLIRDVFQLGGKVTLFTRPRRFGKTLALSMLRTFFELEYDRNGNVADKKSTLRERRSWMRLPKYWKRWGNILLQYYKFIWY